MKRAAWEVVGRVGFGLLAVYLSVMLSLVMFAMIRRATPPTPPAPSVPTLACNRLSDDTCTEGLWVDVTDMPTDPYEQCLYLLSIPQRVGQNGLAPELCEPVRDVRG